MGFAGKLDQVKCSDTKLMEDKDSMEKLDKTIEQLRKNRSLGISTYVAWNQHEVRRSRNQELGCQELAPSYCKIPI